jgi:transposase
MTKKKNGRPKAVDYNHFVKVWRGAKSVGEVAKTFGIKKNSASSIAKRLRDKGIKLKSFPRRAAQPIDPKRLNKVAEAR